MKPSSKAGRVLKAIVDGAVTVADIEADLDFKVTRRIISAHISVLVTHGKVRRTGTFDVRSDKGGPGLASYEATDLGRVAVRDMERQRQ